MYFNGREQEGVEITIHVKKERFGTNKIILQMLDLVKVF